MEYKIAVENIKCGGCANGIKQKLSAIDGLTNVDVEVEQGLVSIDTSDVYEDLTVVNAAKEQLLKMGYPEQGSVEGLKAAGAKAKSFVSCAIGKMTDDKE